MRGDPPQRTEVARATLLLDWEAGSPGGFDWGEPYYDDEDDPENRSRYPLLEVNVAAWRVEAVDGVTRHTLEIEWPHFLEAELLFRSDGGPCPMPRLACSASACTLSP